MNEPFKVGKGQSSALLCGTLLALAVGSLLSSCRTFKKSYVRQTTRLYLSASRYINISDGERLHEELFSFRQQEMDSMLPARFEGISAAPVAPGSRSRPAAPVCRASAGSIIISNPSDDSCFLWINEQRKGGGSKIIRQVLPPQKRCVLRPEGEIQILIVAKEQNLYRDNLSIRRDKWSDYGAEPKPGNCYTLIRGSGGQLYQLIVTE